MTVKVKFLAILVCALILLTLKPSQVFLEDDEKDAGEAEKPVEATLTYSEDWAVLSAINTPDPKTPQINNNYIPLPNPQVAQGFRCNAEPDKCRLDVDGDGEYDTDLRAKENFQTFNIEYASGLKMPYRMRIFYQGTTSSGRKNWQFQRACFMTAKTPIETFTFIDDDNNGNFGDYGKDAILIGKGERMAVPFSSVILVKGKFYNISVRTLDELPAGRDKIKNYSGMIVSLTPYTGDSGKIDLVKNLTPPEEKPSAIIIKGGEDMYFSLTDKPTEVPIGEYFLVSAIFGKRCRARSSEQPLCTVEKGGLAAPKWGGPFKLKISPYCEKGGEVTMVTPPARLVAPVYGRKFIDCPFIKMNYPTVTGVVGEEYYASDEFKDERGFAFPDGGVFGFKVEILPKDAAPNTKPINKTVANPFCADWMAVNLSGLVQKAPPFLEDYRCPIEKYRGIVVVKVWANARVFGGEIMGSKEVEITE